MKRFFRTATVGERGEDFAVLLDGRPIKTPGKKVLALPLRAQADAVAAEWQAQAEDFDPGAMVLTKCANTALDRVAGNEQAVIAGLTANFSDLICYRAVGPDALTARQRAAWDPMVAWAAECLGARLETGIGAAYIVQPDETIVRLQRALSPYDAFALTVLASAAALLGSLILSLAIAEGRLTTEEAFALSRLDESFQSERWGRDEEADARAERLFAELATLAVVLTARKQT